MLAIALIFVTASSEYMSEIYLSRKKDEQIQPIGQNDDDTSLT